MVSRVGCASILIAFVFLVGCGKTEAEPQTSRPVTAASEPAAESPPAPTAMTVSLSCRDWIVERAAWNCSVAALRGLGEQSEAARIGAFEADIAKRGQEACPGFSDAVRQADGIGDTGAKRTIARYRGRGQFFTNEPVSACLSYTKDVVQAEFALGNSTVTATPEVVPAGWSISPASTFEMVDESDDEYARGNILFFIKGNEIFSKTESAKALSDGVGKYEIEFVCGNNGASIEFHYPKEGTGRDEIFVSDRGAQLQPSRGNWKRYDGNFPFASIIGINNASGSPPSQNYLNYVAIQSIVGEVIKNGSVKIGKLPPIYFKQQNNILERIANKCRLN